MTDDQAHELQMARDQFRNHVLAGCYVVTADYGKPSIDWKNLDKSEPLNVICLAMIVAAAQIIILNGLFPS